MGSTILGAVGKAGGPWRASCQAPCYRRRVSRDLRLQVGRGGCIGSDTDSRVCTARCETMWVCRVESGRWPLIEQHWAGSSLFGSQSPQLENEITGLCSEERVEEVRKGTACFVPLNSQG